MSSPEYRSGSTKSVRITPLAITCAERAFFASEGTAVDATATTAAAGFIAVLCALRMWPYPPWLPSVLGGFPERAASNLEFDLNEREQ